MQQSFAPVDRITAKSDSKRIARTVQPLRLQKKVALNQQPECPGFAVFL